MAIGRRTLSPLLGNEAPLLPFVLVIATSGYLGGRGPGLLSLVASLAAAHLLFAHLSGFPGHDIVWAAHLILFAIVGVLITEGIHRLQKAGAALRASERRMRAILDRASAVVFFKDHAGRYLFVNDEFLRIFAFEHSFVIGKTEAELFPSTFATDMRTHDLHVWESGTHLTAEEVVPHTDGLRTYVATKFPAAGCGGCAVRTLRNRYRHHCAEKHRRGATAGRSAQGYFSRDVVS